MTDSGLGSGAVLGGRYELVHRIAGGGMGEVWQGRDTVLGRDVAVKVLRREYVDDADFRTRFRAEARHAAALTHPGIAAVFDYGEAAGTAYLVLELVRGEALSTILARDGRLGVDRTLDVVAQTARALQAAHDAGVIHRDIKPGNLLVATDGSVKVTDFGIARATGAAPITRTGTVMGTAHYLSPEQAAGQPATPASDLYALGVVAYECLAGTRPFTGDAPVQVALAHLHDEPPPLPPDVPAPVADLVGALLAKDPVGRPASAGEVAARAAALRGGTAPTTVLPPTAVLSVGAAGADGTVGTGTGRPAPGRRLALVAVLALLVLAAALLLANQGSTPTAGNVPAGGGTPSPSGPPSPGVVTIDRRTFIGATYTDAASTLRQLGLTVTRLNRQTTDRPPETVLDVTPDGTVPLTQPVTLTVATPPPSPPPGQKTGKGKGNNHDD